MTLTTWPDILDVFSISAGPKRPGPHPHRRWISGVTLLTDQAGVPFEAVIIKSQLKARTISLPLKARTPRKSPREDV